MKLAINVALFFALAALPASVLGEATDDSSSVNIRLASQLIWYFNSSIAVSCKNGDGVATAFLTDTVFKKTEKFPERRLVVIPVHGCKNGDIFNITVCSSKTCIDHEATLWERVDYNLQVNPYHICGKEETAAGQCHGLWRGGNTVSTYWRPW